ncbi:MAG TPA: BrnT family toxin, partial [Caldithrix sp.]|nr:BrnT family toxin [Caldithrix sp.]
MQYNFEWDPKKAKRNNQKYNITFELAATVFRDPRMLTIFDEEHSEFEERWVTLGLARNGILVLVV